MKSTALALTLASTLFGCSGTSSDPMPTAEPPPPEPAQPEQTAPPKTWAPAAPAGWATARAIGQGWSLTAALAPEPAEGAAVPEGRVTLERGGVIVAQRPLAELAKPPDGESWTLTAARQAAGERHVVTIAVGGVVGADYLEHKRALIVLPDDPQALDPLWAGDGGWDQSMMGSCETGITLGFGIAGDTLIIGRAPYGRWVADPPTEDWQREIHGQCAAPKAPPPTRIPLK